MSEKDKDKKKQQPQPIDQNDVTSHSQFIILKVADARSIIIDLHPLAKLPLTEVFPTFKMCLKKVSKKNEFQAKQVEQHKNGLKRMTSMANRMGINDNDQEMVEGNEFVHSDRPVLTEDINLDQIKLELKDEDSNPYLSLGYGMIAYFRMIRTMIVLFFTFTLLSIPALSIYGKYDGLKGLSNYSRAQYSLGNMGFSAPMCQSIQLGVQQIELKCKVGHIEQIYSYGIISPSVSFGQGAYCGKASEVSSIDECTNRSVNKSSIERFYSSNCLEQSSCKVNLSQHVDKSNVTCINNRTLFYVQYFCKQLDDDITLKRREALVVVSIGVFICLLFLCALYYLYETSKIEYKTWDVNTVTAADFTVECNIPQEMWNKFVEQYKDTIEPNETMINKFHDEFKLEVERVVQSENSVLQDKQYENIKISTIAFAFDNVKLISLLQQRGMMVTKVLPDKVKQIDERINKYKADKKDRITRPVAAFITFESQEGYERACNLKGQKNWLQDVKHSKHKYFDLPLCFNEAPEPTDIIWENRNKSYRQQLRRKFRVVLIIIALLVLAFIAFYYLKLETIANVKKYPSTTDCDSIAGYFNKDYDNANFRYFAEVDMSLTQRKQGTGIYQCFCKDYKEKQTSFFKATFCNQYQSDQVQGVGLSQAVSVIIVIVNFILRTIVMALIKLIGYHTESQQTQAIKSSIFVSQFFNTAILLLMTNANTQQTWLAFLPFEGIYPDMTYEWYNDIGSSLIITMLVAAFFPIADFLIFYSLRTVLRCLDRGCSCNKDKTKCKSVQGYVNLYSGPDYMMHFKYSAMLNMTFVTFMYGLALPLLFPIACSYFIIHYTVERLCLTYYFKKPPMFDEKLNKSVLNTMKWAPVFMMLFSYWVMGNKQIFENQVNHKQYRTDTITTDHTGYDVAADQSLPCFFMGIAMFIFVFSNDWFVSILIKLKIMKQNEDIEVDEQLGSYNLCLGMKNRQQMLFEEHYFRKEFGIKTLSNEAFKQLRHSQGHNKVIKTCHNYQIVSNPKYYQAFQYTPVDLRNTPEEKIASDAVAKMLYLAYFPENQQRRITIQDQSKPHQDGPNTEADKNLLYDQESQLSGIEYPEEIEETVPKNKLVDIGRSLTKQTFYN
eukprot:403346963